MCLPGYFLSGGLSGFLVVSFSLDVCLDVLMAVWISGWFSWCLDVMTSLRMSGTVDVRMYPSPPLLVQQDVWKSEIFLFVSG